MRIDFIENLRERLQNEASGLEDVVEKLEQDSKNLNLGKQQGLIEETLMSQHEATAKRLLRVVSDDPDALAALENITTLRQRVRDAIRVSFAQLDR